MLKIIKNVLILILIVLLATGISIKFSPITSIDPSTLVDQMPETNVSLSCNLSNQCIENPHSITVLHNSNKKQTLSFYDDYLLTGKLYKNGKFYKTLNFNRLDSKRPLEIEVNNENPYKINLDLSKDNLMIPTGKYKLVINTNAIGLRYSCKALELNLDYISNSPYIKAQNTIPNEQLTPLTLYYLCNDYNIEQPIGITRFSSIKKKTINSTLEELQNCPAYSTGLCNISPIRKFNYVSKKNGLTYVDLPSNEAIYTDPKTAKKTMSAILKTICALNNNSKVKFLVDYHKAKTFFDGVDISKSIPCNTNNKAFLAYDSGKRFFLVECEVPSISKSDDIPTKAKLIFDAMKKNEYHGLLNLIPDNIFLLNSSYKSGVLTLSFNSSFLKAHNDIKNTQTMNSMMMDAILFSFCSIDHVNSIVIKIDGRAVTDFEGYDFTKPVKKPLYINPEYLSVTE